MDGSSIALRVAAEKITNRNKMNRGDIEENGKSIYCGFCRGKNSLCSPGPSSYYCYRPLLLEMDQSFVFMLPESILLHIFCFLDHKDLLSMRCVSKQCKRIAEDRHLWRYLNMSCKRVFENHFIFRLPHQIRQQVKTVNLMWAHISIPSFNSIKGLFVNMEILLMQYCKFSLQFKESVDVLNVTNPLPTQLKILDLRNVHGRWFDDTKVISAWPNIEAMAFSQTMPVDWMSRFSMTGLPKLRIICIENNPSLTDSFMSGIIQNSPKLQSVSLHGCMYIRGTFLKALVKYSRSIETLDLSGTRLEGKSVTTVDWSKLKIKSLNISFCCKIFESDLVNVLPKLKDLEQFRGSFTGWGRALSDQVLSKMSTTVLLETIDIQSTFNLSVKALAKLCTHSPRLKHLRIGTILKTSDELTMFVKAIPHIQNLSLQLGDATFSAACLFESLASKCKELESLFTYNATYESCSEDMLYSSLVILFTSCKNLKNFFTGGYAHHIKMKVDGAIKSVTDRLDINMNTKKPTRIIPIPRISFDRYLCDILTKSRITKSLKLTIQRTLNCQSFYKTGLQKLDEYHFSLLRS